MRALEGCFKQAQDQGTEEVSIRITEEVIKDPTKYMSAEFIKFLLQRFMNTEGREQMVTKLMLNTKLSINMFPDEMWDLYILHQMKNNLHQKVLEMIDSVAALIVTDILPKLYNKVIEVHVQLKYRQ
jgi:hypothetical protein